ncbi:MAG: tetratricopeptide repeat protein [Aureispira sp.]
MAQDLHSPAELLDVLEKSTYSYDLNRLEKTIEADDRVLVNSNTFYRKTEEDGFTTLEVELTKEATIMKEKAEQLFQKKEYEKARLLYDELLDQHPEYSKLLVYIGQTYHLEGEVEKAIPFYKKAVEQNFIDYMGHWFLGRAMWDLGKVDDCLASYMVAHLLNRNHPLLMKELVKVLAANGLEYNAWRFVPQIELEQEDSIHIKVAYADGWMGYALAKAVWTFEPSHSEEMEEVFGAPSITQEKEALISFYITYKTGNKKLAKAPFVLGFEKALEIKKVNAFILYEIFLIEQPSIAYQLSLDNFMSLSEYVLETHCSIIKGKKKKKKKKKKRK